MDNEPKPHEERRRELYGDDNEGTLPLVVGSLLALGLLALTTGFIGVGFWAHWSVGVLCSGLSLVGWSFVIAAASARR